MISHAFRNEAQRELSHCFPCLRGASRARAWYLSLERSPHIATNIRGVVLLLPPSSTFPDIIRVIWALCKCVNLKELVVLLEECQPRRFRSRQEYPSLTYISYGSQFKFKLTKFVNGYFSQNDVRFREFLRSQPDLESLELHSGNLDVSRGQFSLSELKTLGCPPQFFNPGQDYSLMRLRLDFDDSTDDCELDILGRVLRRNINRSMKSLSIFLNQSQSHFPEIMRVIAVSHLYIQHLEIHQFIPTEVRP
jgi:hypothetical protein